jgi:hypothetical protein
MAKVTHLGEAGLQGWREKVADAVSTPIADRTRLDEDQVRAAIGLAFFALSVIYVVKTVGDAARRG